MQLLKIFFKINESAEIINLMLTHQIVSFFLNSELKFSIYDFFVIDRISVVVHV